VVFAAREVLGDWVVVEKATGRVGIEDQCVHVFVPTKVDIGV